MTEGPRIVHLDDLPWQEVRRQQHGDRTVVCRKGTHLALDQGATFGPFPADLGGYERFLAERGVEQLPNPPIDMPDWLRDTRT